MTREEILVSAEPGAIRSDPRGFDRLSRLHRQLVEYVDQTISIDLSRLSWFDGHMASPFRMIIKKVESRRNKVVFTNAPTSIETVLRKNGFLPGPIPDVHQTTIPITDFGLEAAVAFSLYAKKHLDRPEMPKMSRALTGKFFEGIDELFANAALHSRSSLGVTACGQFFPLSNKLDFAITDAGIGIPEVVGRLAGAVADAEAIEWAMTEGNTTRQGDIPGGLGSKVVREFVQLNQGKLMIVSYGGFWCQSANTVLKGRINNAFPGTFVLLEINTSDRKAYDLAHAPDPRNIW